MEPTQPTESDVLRTDILHVLLSDGTTHTITIAQKDFIDTFLESRNPELAAQEAHEELAVCRKWWDDPKFAQLFDELSVQKLKAGRMSLEMLDAKLYDAITGKVQLTKSQVIALNTAYKRFQGGGGKGKAVKFNLKDS